MMISDKISMPDHVMKARLKTGYKTKLLWASFDGVDRLEIYKNQDESDWLATVYLDSGLTTYYWRKYSVKPNTKKYELSIPEIFLTLSKFEVERVTWE
jgi:hypothetical protein